MSTVTIQLTNVCPGGGHLTFTISGAKSMTVLLGIEQLLEPVTDEEAAIVCKCVARLIKAGRTNAQARTVLEAGVVVGQ